MREPGSFGRVKPEVAQAAVARRREASQVRAPGRFDRLRGHHRTVPAQFGGDDMVFTTDTFGGGVIRPFGCFLSKLLVTSGVFVPSSKARST